METNSPYYGVISNLSLDIVVSVTYSPVYNRNEHHQVNIDSWNNNGKEKLVDIISSQK